jgi:outer membrane protein OmpA-like peptidoglycan-associated protein
MALSYGKVAGFVACGLLVFGLIPSTIAVPAAAEDISADQIINALAPPATRGLNAPQQPEMSDADSAFIESLRHRTRGLSLDESNHVAEIAKNRPKIDLEIFFDFDSAAITAKAEPQLKQLGDALHSSRLEDSVIVVNGHTDAKGGAKYNQMLSERRALAVKQYLVDKLKMSPENLTSAGYGERDLKNKADPYAAENRRVQIVNLGSSNRAKR